MKIRFRLSSASRFALLFSSILILCSISWVVVTQKSPTYAVCDDRCDTPSPTVGITPTATPTIGVTPTATPTMGVTPTPTTKVTPTAIPTKGVTPTVTSTPGATPTTTTVAGTTPTTLPGTPSTNNNGQPTAVATPNVVVTQSSGEAPTPSSSQSTPTSSSLNAIKNRAVDQQNFSLLPLWIGLSAIGGVGLGVVIILLINSRKAALAQSKKQIGRREISWETFRQNYQNATAVSQPPLLLPPTSSVNPGGSGVSSWPVRQWSASTSTGWGQTASTDHDGSTFLNDPAFKDMLDQYNANGQTTRQLQEP